MSFHTTSVLPSTLLTKRPMSSCGAPVRRAVEGACTLMALAVAAFLFLPWLDRAKNKSIRYRGLASKLLLGMFFVTFVVLMWLGLKPADPLYVTLARICTVSYFAFFLLLPFVSKADGNGPVPDRVTYHAH